MKREVQRIRITNTNKENFIRRITNNEYDYFLIRYSKFYSKILFGRTLRNSNKFFYYELTINVAINSKKQRNSTSTTTSPPQVRKALLSASCRDAVYPLIDCFKF